MVSVARDADPSRFDGSRAAIAVAAALALFTCCWVGIHFGQLGSYQIRDTPQYETWGREMTDGRVPYRDFSVEYLPGALPVFLLPAITAGRSHRSYEISFETLMLLCGFATIGAVALTLRRLGGDLRSSVGNLAFVAVSPLLLGNVSLSRFDLFPAALAAAGVAATLGESPVLAGSLLGVGTAVKLYPILFIPFAAVYFGRRSRDSARRLIVAAATTIAVIVLPFLAIAPHGVIASVRDQASRPLQIESLGSSIALVAHQVYGQSLGVAFSYSWNLAGPTAKLIAAGQVVAQALAILALLLAFWRGPATPQRLVRYLAAAIIAFVVFGKVLSPQYLIWLVPAVAIVAGRRGRIAVVLLEVALVATQLYFPRRFGPLVTNFDPMATWLLATRNLLLVAMLAILAWPGLEADSRHKPAIASPNDPEA